MRLSLTGVHAFHTLRVHPYVIGPADPGRVISKQNRVICASTSLDRFSFLSCTDSFCLLERMGTT